MMGEREVSVTDIDLVETYSRDFTEMDEITTESQPLSLYLRRGGYRLDPEFTTHKVEEHESKEETESTSDSHNYSQMDNKSLSGCESDESESPEYHCLKVVPHGRHYPAVLTDPLHTKKVFRAPTLLPIPKMQMSSIWHKQPEPQSCTTSNSYRSIQESVQSSNSNYGSDFTLQDILQEISERTSEAYLYTLQYCGLPVLLKPRKWAVYAISSLVILNAIAVILSWVTLFNIDPSPSIIIYCHSIMLGISCIPSFFVFIACKFNPFAALSAFASTAFSGTLATGLLEAFFVANNKENFEDTKMATLGSATAAFDIIASLLWLIVIIFALIFYTADSQQRGYYVMRFVSFNLLAILVLVTFLLTLLMDVTFFNNAGQIDIMYLAVAFSILSMLFSLCFCFCTGLALKERESCEQDKWSRIISLLPFVLCSILTIISFICGILSMVIGTNLTHHLDYNVKYGESTASLAYLVGTLNFAVSIATIAVGCILGVQMYM